MGAVNGFSVEQVNRPTAPPSPRGLRVPGTIFINVSCTLYLAGRPGGLFIVVTLDYYYLVLDSVGPIPTVLRF